MLYICIFSNKFDLKQAIRVSHTEMSWVLFPSQANHRDKTRVKTPAKMFPHLILLCWLFMGPTLGFDT